MSAAASHTFSLKVSGLGPEQLVVSAVEGMEAVSRPFRLQVDFLPLDGRPLDWAGLLGKPAVVELQMVGAEARVVHGRVHAAESLQPFGRWPRYRVHVGPDLALLGSVRRSRVFQDKSTPQIVKAVLGEDGIKHRWALSGSYDPREYCIQYRETDLDFVCRLLEWEGIHFFFEHSSSGHVLVLSDSAAAAAGTPGGGDLPFGEERGLVEEAEHVTRWETVRRLRPGAVVTRDFDFKSPSLDLTATTQAQGAPADLELYDHAEGYATPGAGKAVAAVRLEERRQRSHTLVGGTTCPRLLPGYTFRVEDPAPKGVAGKYFALEVQHQGVRQIAYQSHLVPEEGQYRNEVRCLPDGTTHRPRRRVPWPVVPGVQTATVVGPSGEEIHPDQHGRIKVQFHWDREGGKNDRSSCFIRVGQRWGGPSWGGVFLPRVGQEVVVRFLEGNPDRPLITGAVYNGANPVPYTLPDQKTLSTLKSSSSKGGNGFNELRLEDAAGEEEVFLHAQKDEQFITENDKAQEVGRFEARLVKKDRSSTVEGDQSLQVVQHDSGTVGQDQTLQVVQNRATTVSRNHSESVDGHQTVQVAKTRAVQVALTSNTAVGAAATLHVGAELTVAVALAAETMVAGALSRTVGGDVTENLVGSRQESVGKDSSLKVEGDSEGDIKGQVSLNVGQDLTIEVKGAARSESQEATGWPAKAVILKADKLSVVVGGKRILQMEKSGDLTITASSVSVDGSDVKLKGTNVKKEQPDSPPSAQVEALELAAVNGNPFCEECEKRKKAAAAK